MKAEAGGSWYDQRLMLLMLVAGAVLPSTFCSARAAAICPSVGTGEFGAEAPIEINAECEDPDYNQKTFVIDATQQLSLKLPDGSSIPYTEVKGHFPATRTPSALPAGVSGSPTTVQHGVTWRFPGKAYWHNRFFQQSYPLAMEFLNVVDSRFAFTNGAYTVGITPGSPNVGYRVSAAAAKLAKDYANKLYGDSQRIYGYIYGQSGGSVQMMGANEGTSGVWDGIVPVVIAIDGLNTHSFQWDALYALAAPEAKRRTIAAAVAPGSGQDIYTGLTNDERAILDELLNAGFQPQALEDWKFSVGMALPLSGPIVKFDATYEDDFWSKPGYEGTNPPAYLAAAKVDGFATITGLTVEGKKAVTAITFDRATVPALGSIGDEALQFYVYGADGVTRITHGNATGLSGKLAGNQLTLTGNNDPILLKALVSGGKIRINNRFALASCFYPRHSILDNGNPTYNQYRTADGTAKYVQRPVQIVFANNISSSGGRRETGKLKVKTIVIENLSDPASYPYVGGFYAGQVHNALGDKAAQNMFRIYYQDNATHGAFPTPSPVPVTPDFDTKIADVGGILNQALLDLAAWVERGVPPLPSTRYRFNAMNHVVLPKGATERHGLQPVIDLTANGALRAEVSVNELVTLVGKIEMPPSAGKIVHYDWYVGAKDFRYEPVIKVGKPRTRLSVTRAVRFAEPGEYSIVLRADGQRDGVDAANTTTLLQNLARVKVLVRP